MVTPIEPERIREELEPRERTNYYLHPGAAQDSFRRKPFDIHPKVQNRVKFASALY
jgi:hypothetical protein